MPHHQSTPNHPVGGSAYPGSAVGPGFVPGRMDRRTDGMMMHYGMHPGVGMPHPHAWMPGPPQPPLHPPHMNHPRGPPGGFPDGRGHAQMNMPATVSSYDSNCSYSSTVPSPSGGHLSPKQDYSSARMSRFSTVPSFDSATRQHSKSDDDQSLSTERSVPLKKRKTISSQPNAPTSQELAQISPVTMHVTPNTTMQDETSSASGTPHTSPAISNSVVTYSGEKSGEHSKVGGGTHSANTVLQTPIQEKKKSSPPPLHFVIPDFPTLLHSLLTDSEYAGKVVLWLPHGRAWRIVRWDALRRQVLPSLFPQLCEDEKSSMTASPVSSAGSIDAFLWHLTAWGFEEITDGDDAGAYSHELFRKDDPEKCRDMKFAPSFEDNDAPTSQEHADTAKHTCSILRVPSLATPSVDSTGQPGANAPDDSNDVNKSTTTNDFSNWPVDTKTTTTTTTESRPVFVNAENDQWREGGVRVLHRMPPYSPIRIRSSRGGSRMVSRPSTEKVQRHGYPVSTRGRRRVGVANRSIDELSSLAAATTTTVSHDGTAEAPLKMLEKEQRTVETPAKEEPTGAAEAEAAESSPPTSVDETTPPRSVLKRRLPLSRENSKSSGVGERDNEQDNAIKPSLSNSSSGSSATESTSGSTTT